LLKYNCLIKFTKNIKIKLEKYQKSIQKTARKLVNSFKDTVVRNILDRIRKTIVSMNRTKKVIIDLTCTRLAGHIESLL